MRVARGLGRGTFDMSISVRRPGDVDMLVLEPTGAIQAYLRANAAEVGLYIAEDRVLYRGPATGDAFSRALGFDLSAADAVAVLLGYGVDAESLPLGRASWDGKLRRVRVDYGDRASAWIHPVTMLFDRVEHRDQHGSVVAEVREWTAETPPLPSLVELQVQPEGYRISLTLLGSNLDRDPEFPPGYFDLQAPPRTLELPLSALEAQGGLFQRSLPEEEDAQERR